MKIALFLPLLLIASTLRSVAQNPDDSLRLVDHRNWRVISQTDGMVCRLYDSQLSSRVVNPLFNTSQIIYVVEIDTSRYMLALDQFSERQKVSRAAERSDLEPLAAVNGGFYVTGIREAIPADFVSIMGVEYSGRGGWSSSLFAYDRPTSQLYIGAHTNQQPVWTDMMVAGPLLVKSGAVMLPWVERSPVGEYDKQQLHAIFAPRTAVGVRSDGKVLLIVVDGRRRDSFGMSLEWLAVVGRWLGLHDMINFDGGGSSTMWIRGCGVVNSPSDGKSFIHLERKVANALMVVPR